ncbi:probable arabinosyltransferase ARAD1 isoform X2 [Olea europaea var. sylvestris]|uniref:probable arabinosyltransferase ARAD1 isoform X2 n=1 Tax=Olea europaea var. sylvestris TaxID=158386 RepID=UPI000C1D8A2A|nr:probable arabinosyltransferase ARAD1 isoform X2 [Olea europaea var. sylvestris]
MRKSLFCPNPAGDTPSSARLVDAIVSGCIPVVISDELELPFEVILDYRKHSRHFLYSHPAQPMGPEELVWRMKYF